MQLRMFVEVAVSFIPPTVQPRKDPANMKVRGYAEKLMPLLTLGLFLDQCYCLVLFHFSVPAHYPRTNCFMFLIYIYMSIVSEN